MLGTFHRNKNAYHQCDVDVLHLLLEHGSTAQNERGMEGLCEFLTLRVGGASPVPVLKCAIEYHRSMGRDPLSADLFRLDTATVNDGCWDDRDAKLATLKYLHGVGCPIDDTPLSNTHAAVCGDLDRLQYLCSIGCPMDEGTCRWAAMRGELECLQYLRSVNCPWDERTIAEALPSPDPKRTTTQIEVRAWALANGCPEPPGPLTYTLNGGRERSSFGRLWTAGFDHTPFLHQGSFTLWQ